MPIEASPLLPDDSEPLSPELVLVSSELREYAISRLEPQWRVEPPDTPVPIAARHDNPLLGSIEVTKRVPVLLVLAVWAALSVARVMLIVGIPVVAAVAVLSVLGS